MPACQGSAALAAAPTAIRLMPLSTAAMGRQSVGLKVMATSCLGVGLRSRAKRPGKELRSFPFQGSADHGERYAEHRPPWLGLHLDRAFVPVDESPDDVEAEPRPLPYGL